MNWIFFAFLKSHIKKAIYELEVANKMKQECIDTKLIDELKHRLAELTLEQDKEEENNG